MVTTPHTSMLSLTATTVAVQRPGGRALAGGQRRDDGVQRRGRLHPGVRGQQLEIGHLAHAPAGLDLPDQLHRPGDQRPAQAVQQRLHRALAHGQVAVDARVRLGRAAVERHEPLDRALEVVGVEAVERLRRRLGRLEHLAGQAEEQRPVARLGQRVGDRQIATRRWRTASPRRPPWPTGSRARCPSPRRRGRRRSAPPAASARRRARRPRTSRARRSGSGRARGSRRRSSRTRRPSRSPTASAISGSLRPFCSDTTNPSAASRGAMRASASRVCWRLTASSTASSPSGSSSGDDGAGLAP